jgi:hypothetical protein
MIGFGRLLRLSAVVLFLMLAAVPAAASPGGSDARLCQKGGYLEYVRDDGTPFANPVECVRYVASKQALVPLAIRFDGIPGNEDIFCGFEIVLVNFPVGEYEIEVVSEIFNGPTGTIEVNAPLSETITLHAEAIEPVGPSLDVAATVTNPVTGLSLSASAVIAPCLEA